MTFNPAHYPKDWKSLRRAALERAGYRCECTGECGHPHEESWLGADLCGAPQYFLLQRKKGAGWAWVPAYSVGETPQHDKPVKVILTTAHLCQTSTCADLDCLKILCQWCHLHLDKAQHATSRRQTRDKKRGQLALQEGTR